MTDQQTQNVYAIAIVLGAFRQHWPPAHEALGTVDPGPFLELDPAWAVDMAADEHIYRYAREQVLEETLNFAHELLVHRHAGDWQGRAAEFTERLEALAAAALQSLRESGRDGPPSEPRTS